MTRVEEKNPRRRGWDAGATHDTARRAARTDTPQARARRRRRPVDASTARAACRHDATRVQDGHTYGRSPTATSRSGARRPQAFVEQGNAIFHDAKQLGGTIGVSCDMCHPNAANTHPETYPKYQVQLGRVAMLRDMINWCIENPVRGKPLADDDPR